MPSAGKDLETGAPTGMASSTARSGGVSTARVIELVDSRRRDSIKYNYSLFARLQRWYDSYRGYWSGGFSQYRNNVSIPFTFAMIQSDVARKVQTTFGAWPIVTFEGYAPEDVGRAKKNEVLVSAQMKDCRSLIKAIDFMLQADICGTGVARYGWDYRVRKNRYVKYEQIAPGMRVPVRHEGESEIFNGPTWDPIDRLDFWQQPAKKSIDDMDWVIHRYWMDLDEMMEDAASDQPYFDPQAVKLLKQVPLTGMGQAQFLERRVRFRNQYDYVARQTERFAKPVEIWEMHGSVPSEFAPDGYRHRCVAVANGRVVVKNREGPLPDQDKPFKSYAPMGDPYSFDGIGKAEIAYGPQMTVNRLANQKLDALDQLIDPMWVMSNQANINQQNLFTRAGRILLVDGAADDSNIRPLTPNMQGLQAAYTEIGQLWQFMQLGAGINDIVMGLSQGDRETARGFLGRQENVMTRLSFEARQLEEQFVEPLANGFRKLDREMLDLPHEISILGSLASVNPNTGLPYPAEHAQIDETDLVPDYRARAVGASQQLSRSIRQQNLVSLLQMFNGNPALMQIVNWANFARQALQLFDFQNVDELLVQQIPAVNTLAQNSGQDPNAMAQMLSGGPQALQGLNPQLTQALGNHAPAAMLSGLTGGGR